jgi:hypothetical protein
MNRRGFLQTLAAGLAGAALDPERLLWKPGAKTFFLPTLKPIVQPVGWVVSAGGLFMPGDIVTLAGHYAMNPLTRQPTKHLQQFVVTMGTISEGWALSPRIVDAGPYRNVSQGPQGGAGNVLVGR